VSKVSDQVLQSAFQRGVIPGPNESEEAFLSRYSLPSQKIAHKLDHFLIDWVPVLYKNEGLRFWEGACTWIDDSQAVLQMRKQFRNRTLLWGMYSKKELVDHELVHAVRLKFDEPKFEEFLAYSRSQNKFRRFFGPIYQNPKETLLYVVLAALVPIPPLTSFMLPIFFGVTALALARLIYRQTLFQRAFQTASKILKCESEVPSFMVHLTDHEITLFAKGKGVEDYISQQRCLRWRQIKLAYSIFTFS
jgi:hypothetical protein